MTAPNPGGAASSTGPEPAGRGELVTVVVATVPAIAAYYVGWAYLYFYLSAFGIGISELDLGIETIFIYSMPPIAILATGYWHVVLGVLVLVVALAWLNRRLGMPLSAAVGRFRAHVRQVSLLVQGLYLFLSLVIIALLAAPAIRGAASQRADQKWEREGVHIQALVKEPDAKTPQYDNYRRCLERRGLDLIFADRESYFMLCISEINSASAVVFEVRREHGLASVRFVTR